MTNMFLIELSCNSYIDRPPISYKAIEYLQEFIETNLLAPRKIIVGTKWKIWLSACFVKPSNYGPKGLHLYKPMSVSSDYVKIYPIDIPLIEIQSSDNAFKKTVDLLLDAAELFLIQTYKKMTQQAIREEYKKIDWEYILSLPYPAEVSEQRYIGDMELPGGAFILQQN